MALVDRSKAFSPASSVFFWQGLVSAVVLLVSADARAQTCIGISDIVCTNTGAVGVFQDPPSGPVTGTTSLININTATGTADSIRAMTEFGNATAINYGAVNGGLSSRNGLFGVPALATAITVNYGTVGGNVVATADSSGDAVIYNAGVASGTLSASVRSSTFGSARVFNSGQARNINAQTINSGTAGTQLRQINPSGKNSLFPKPETPL